MYRISSLHRLFLFGQGVRHKTNGYTDIQVNIGVPIACAGHVGLIYNSNNSLIGNISSGKCHKIEIDVINANSLTYYVLARRN